MQKCVAPPMLLLLAILATIACEQIPPEPPEPKPKPPPIRPIPPPLRCFKPNEEYRKCSSCEGTCKRPNPICPRICFPPKCQCKSGYVREKGLCIDKKRCPNPCSAIRCLPGYKCVVDNNNKPRCIKINPCATVLCRPGYKCEVDCAQKPKCIQINPCIGYSCPSGKKCILKKVFCFCAPCPLIPDCQPIG